MTEEFPYEQLITRTETGKIRHLYLVSKNGATLLRYNPALKVRASAQALLCGSVLVWEAKR